MRELNLIELDSVSGASFSGDLGFKLGEAIGGVVDWANTTIYGAAPASSAVTPVATFFQGIGLLTDSLFSHQGSLTTALSTAGDGIAQMLHSAFTNWKAYQHS